MTRFYETLAHWLADYFLLSTVLLALALAALAAIKQPAQRRAITQSTLFALILLAALCALPGWSTLSLMTSRQPALHHVPSAELVDVVEREFTANAPPAQLNVVSQAPPAITPPLSIDQPTPADVWREVSWSSLAVVVWGVGAACVVVWLAVGSFAARRLRRSAQAAPADLFALLKEVTDLNGRDRRHAELLTSSRIDVAVALGIWRPVVLLPTKWIATQSRDDLRTVLAHEGTHLRNNDLHWLAVSRGLTVLLWAQPLYWLVRRRMRLDQEALADAAAAELTSRARYAEQLVAWARDIAARPAVRFSSAVGLWEGRSQLRRRIALLIDEHFTVLRACSRRWRMTSTSLIAAAVIALSMVTLQPATHAKDDEEGKQTASEPAPLETRHSLQGPASVAVFRAGTLPKPPMYKKNALAVKVVDAAGKPIAGVDALLFRASLQNGKHELIKRDLTNERGEVDFVDLVPPTRVAEYEKIAAGTKIRPSQDASFIVALKRPGLSTVMVYGSDFEVALHGAHSNVRMKPAAELRGRVTDSQGQPVAGALVAAGSWGGSFAIEGVNATKTDAEGQYVFTDRAIFDAEAARAQQRHELRLFTATVREEGAKSDPRDASTDLAASDLVVTHADFAVTNVQGGDIPGTTDVQLAPVVSIAGRVVQFDGGEPASGVPVKAVALARQQVAPEKSGDTDLAGVSVHSAATQTDERGRYRLTNLPAGDYDVWVQPAANDWKDVEWVSRGIRGVRAAPGPEPIAAPDLVIGPGGKIRGQLVDADNGKPIPVGNDSPFVRTFFQLIDGPQMQETLMQTVPVTPEGAFEIRTFPGKVRIGVFVYLHKTAENGQPDYQSDDDFYRSGPVLEADHGKSIDAEFAVRPVAQLEEIRSLQRKGNELFSQEKWDGAIAAFTEVLAKYPTNTSVLAGRGRAHVKVGQFAEAVADFKALLKLSPDDTGAEILLADLLATSPIARTRDGRRAVELAKDAATNARKSQFQSETLALALSTMAAAHAELGEFDKAVDLQQEAIKLAPKSRQAEMRSRLELYENKKPFRRQSPSGENRAR